MALVLRLACLLSLAACEGPASAPADASADVRSGACEPGPAAVPAPVEPGPGLAGVDRTAPASCAGDGRWIVGVQGRVVDPGGAGLAGARTQICAVPAGTDTLLCLAPPTTDAAGDFTALVEDLRARCAERMTLRVLLPGSLRPTVYCELPLEPVDAVLALPSPLVLHPAARPGCLPPRGDETAPRTVVLADGLELVGLRPDRMRGYEELAAGRHDGIGGCLLRRAPPGGFVAAYGLWPETDLEGGVAVRLPNTAGLAPGSVVELYQLGGLSTSLADGTPVDEGAWAAIGTATVAADGAKIESDPGTLLTVLTWLAVRAAG